MPPNRVLVGDGVRVVRLHEGFPTRPASFGLTCLQREGFSRSQNAKGEARAVVPLR